MYKLFFTTFLFFSLQNISFAQDTLPKITVSQLGKKVLISWLNTYTYITTINIQRSGDSLKNFVTIGTVLNVKAVSNGFLDQKEFIPSTQYYRLFISFEGGNYIFTESHRPAKDTNNITPDIINYSQPVKTWFVPSKHVYTGRDNNVIISLPDASRKKYSIKFYEDNGTLLFELKKIPENYLTLDKANFIHAGLFNFELYENSIIIERHKVYIPKEGKPIPALDENGNELN
ncbi:MAG: hypothetical protein M3Z26_05325 [Bacteroidota bacterium]|nr:hypothetical protein [Bacteroidota bacterium]